jgi:hypothetical protein
MPRIVFDSDTKVVEERFAVVFAPRRQRDRFPENCVQLVDSAEAALAGSDPKNKRYAARVIGPSRSSEGLRLYYLVHWLD